MTSSQQLLLDLLYADTEAEVTALVDGDAEMSDKGNWCPLDGRDTNSNVVTNQSTSGAKAATELMTNMVDAILMKRCREMNIDPKGASAPQTMYEAVDKFVFHLNGGKIIKEDNARLMRYAEQNLLIGITGGKSAKQNPCFTFCDNGEGQHPRDFSRTFLSLREKNKSQIPFVQGKYNMGSSGVMSFCGDKWYKLILSRRYDKTGEWGWTLLRKATPESGNDYVEYFAPKGQIKGFSASAPIVPFKTNEGNLYEKFNMQTGTVVKLYEYYLGKNIGFRGAREAFNENLVETILPFRIWDFRWSPDAKRTGERAVGIDSRAFNGMEFLLVRSHADNSDAAESKLIDVISDKRLGEIRISVIVMKKEAESTGWYKSSNSRIFHHVNGQVQYKNTRGYLTQCGFPLLKDRVVILIDSSGMTRSAHHAVWKGDRESILDTQTGEFYKNRIKEALRDSKELKDLHRRISSEEMKATAKDNSQLVKNLIKADINLQSLLNDQIPDILVSNHTREIVVRQDLKRNPTYIRLRRAKDQKILSAINRKRPIQFDTDADDDFLQRPDNQGNVTISNEEIVDKFTWNRVLKNGDLVLFLRPIKGAVSVGDEFKFKVCLESPDMQPVCLSDEVCLEIGPKALPPDPPIDPPDDPKPPSQNPRGIPPYVLLTKDGRDVINQESVKWSDFSGYADCHNKDGGFVQDMGEGRQQYFINYDNVFLHALLRHSREDRSVIEQKYVSGMQVLMLGLEYGIDSNEKAKDPDRVDEIRRAFARGAAAVVLTLCHQFPQKFVAFSTDVSSEDDDA